MFLETMDSQDRRESGTEIGAFHGTAGRIAGPSRKASTGTEYIGRLQFFGPLRVGDSGLSTNIYKSQKKAQKQGRTIVFIDESGLSQKPHRCRTWAPRGETPVLEFNFNWQKLSVSAGLTLRNFYFRLYPGTIGELEVIDFLQALVRHIDRPLLIVWDRLPAHRSRLVREFIELSEGHIATEFLPPYAPELNPVEYIWAYWKQHELPNVCPKDYWELDERARKSLRRMRRKPRLITAFWKQSSLCLD